MFLRRDSMIKNLDKKGATRYERLMTERSFTFGRQEKDQYWKRAVMSGNILR